MGKQPGDHRHQGGLEPGHRDDHIRPLQVGQSFCQPVQTRHPDINVELGLATQEFAGHLRLPGHRGIRSAPCHHRHPALGRFRVPKPQPQRSPQGLVSASRDPGGHLGGIQTGDQQITLLRSVLFD